MQGQTDDIPLTELGHAQAAAGAAELAALGPGALISSDLLRARQTAEHCARATGLPVAVTAALREQGYGVLEGRPVPGAVGRRRLDRSALGRRGRREPGPAARPGRGVPASSCAPSRRPTSSRWSPTATRSGRSRRSRPGSAPRTLPAVTPPNGSVTRVELGAVRWTGPFESAALLTALPVPARLAPSTRGVLRVGAAGRAGARRARRGRRRPGRPAGSRRWWAPSWPSPSSRCSPAACTWTGWPTPPTGWVRCATASARCRSCTRATSARSASSTLVLTLLLQVACAAVLLSADGGWLPLWSAVLVARLAMVADRPAGRGRGGGLVARPRGGRHRLRGRGGPRRSLLGAGLVAGGALLVAGPAGAARLLAAAAAGLLAAELVHRRATARLGGTTGDVMGAMGEVATTASPADRRGALGLGTRVGPLVRGWHHARVTDPTPFAGTLLGTTIAAITPRDAAAERAARERLDRMTKPPGLAGRAGGRGRAAGRHRRQLPGAATRPPRRWRSSPPTTASTPRG